MATDKRKRVPLGKLLKLTDRQLDKLSKVTAVDVAKAQEAWRNTAPPEFKTLLDAETVDNQIEDEQ